MARLGGFLLLVLVPSSLAACPIGTIYGSSYNKCYKYFPQLTDFLSAERNCNAIGGNLVAVQNAFENSYISGVAGASSPNPSFWIGANLLMATRWTWTSGSNGTYLNFAPGQPSDPSMYSCAAFRNTDNMWTKELCSTRKPYMCQIDPNAIPVGNGCTTPSYPMTTAYPTTSDYPTTTSPSACSGDYCSSGYTLNPDACKCYKFVNYPATYKNATAWCGSENATLPYIRNAAENIFLSNYLRRQITIANPYLYPWIGAYCSSSSASSCRWADGSSLFYSNFDTWQPEGGAVYLAEENTKWYTWPDDDVYVNPFVCERNAYWNSAVPRFKSKPNRRNTQRVSNIINI